jgi:putative transposase
MYLEHSLCQIDANRRNVFHGRLSLSVGTIASTSLWHFDAVKGGATIPLLRGRRRVVHFNVTSNPTAQWTAQQIVEAFPFDTAPRYLVRDNDGIYGAAFRRRIRSLDIEDVPTAPRSPWQNPIAERIIGTLRRECLNHVIVLNERHLRRLLKEYVDYYHWSRTHLSLGKNPPEPRDIEPSTSGNIVLFPVLGGLHHRYSRLAA